MPNPLYQMTNEDVALANIILEDQDLQIFLTSHSVPEIQTWLDEVLEPSKWYIKFSSRTDEDGFKIVEAEIFRDEFHPRCQTLQQFLSGTERPRLESQVSQCEATNSKT